MKIILLGTCQVVGMGEALRALLPNATINAYHVRPETQGMDEIAAQLPLCDFVISQILESHNVPLFTMDRLEHMGIPRLAMIPPIVFDGFHPDIHILADTGKQLESPIEAYHSRILAAAFALGLPEARAINLFNWLIYRRLGYDKVFQASKAALADAMAPSGCDTVLDRDWGAWMASGCFMYTPNHPRIDVLASFARFAVERAGLIDPVIATPTGIPDILAQQNVWAVYPEIARALSIPPGMTFRRFRRGDMREEDRSLDLTMFTQRSYEIYNRSNIEILRRDPVIMDTMNVIESCLR
jgi:hypothetical protein